MTRSRSGCVALGVLLTLGFVGLAAAPAFAHIEPDPARVEPGDDATVSFNVEHGCDTSPTTSLTFKIPKGAKHVAPVDKDGWRSEVKGKTVVFDGGSLDAHTEDQFSISFTAPNKKTILVWKVIQQCEEGEIRWIDTSKTAEEPPPRVGVGKNPPAEE
jgi:uncharacterized protein YcnI